MKDARKTQMKDNLQCKTNLNGRQSQREEDTQLDQKTLNQTKTTYMINTIKK